MSSGIEEEVYGPSWYEFHGILFRIVDYLVNDIFTEEFRHFRHFGGRDGSHHFTGFENILRKLACVGACAAHSTVTLVSARCIGRLLEGIRALTVDLHPAGTKIVLPSSDPMASYFLNAWYAVIAASGKDAASSKDSDGGLRAMYCSAQSTYSLQEPRYRSGRRTQTSSPTLNFDTLVPTPSTIPAQSKPILYGNLFRLSLCFRIVQ